MPGFPFTAVIFDMDGVLIDSESYYIRVQKRFAAELGIPITHEELIDSVGRSHQDFQARMVDWWARIGRTVADGNEAEALYEEWAAVQAPLDYATIKNEGACETVRALKERGIRVALASSSPMSNIKQVLSDLGLSDAFEVMVSGEQFRQSKPDPEIYLHALDLLGLDAASCCCVEDSVHGIAAGKAAGLFVVAKREDRFGFSQDAADTIIDTLPDLLELKA